MALKLKAPKRATTTLKNVENIKNQEEEEKEEEEEVASENGVEVEGT